MTGKIVIACDKYKGNMTAMQVCNVIKKAFNEVNKETSIIVSPMADGGEGTVRTLVESFKGKYIELEVAGPTGKKIPSSFGMIEGGKTAVIEMSMASGLWLLKNSERNPLHTTTFGTGELIRRAVEEGASKIIIGIGGSATNDAGIGAAAALGVKFYDKKNNLLDGYGRDLLYIKKIDTGNIIQALKNVKIYVACDVNNPLYGPEGAAYVYAPQKGADIKTVEILDKGLKNFAEIVKKDMNKDVSILQGGGAAGGLGAGLAAFFNAELRPGADIIIKATNLENKIKSADLVITGEGSMDNQTFYGKSACAVAMLAYKYKVPVITINGSVNIDYSKIEIQKRSLFAGNFDTVTRDMKKKDAIKNGKDLLHFTSREIARFYFSVISKSGSKIVRGNI